MSDGWRFGHGYFDEVEILSIISAKQTWDFEPVWYSLFTATCITIIGKFCFYHNRRRVSFVPTCCRTDRTWCNWIWSPVLGTLQPWFVWSHREGHWVCNTKISINASRQHDEAVRGDMLLLLGADWPPEETSHVITLYHIQVSVRLTGDTLSSYFNWQYLRSSLLFALWIEIMCSSWNVFLVKCGLFDWIIFSFKC